MDQTVDGLWVVGSAIHRCESSASAVELGELALRALGDGRRGIPRVTDWKALVAPLLDACAARSWSAIQRRYEYVEVERLGGRVSVIPSRNGGTRGDDKGFHTLTSEVIHISEAVVPDVLGRAIQDAFSRCS
jgi:hypothetical protein